MAGVGGYSEVRFPGLRLVSTPLLALHRIACYRSAVSGKERAKVRYVPWQLAFLSWLTQVWLWGCYAVPAVVAWFQAPYACPRRVS